MLYLMMNPILRFCACIVLGCVDKRENHFEMFKNYICLNMRFISIKARGGNSLKSEHQISMWVLYFTLLSFCFVCLNWLQFSTSPSIWLTAYFNNITHSVTKLYLHSNKGHIAHLPVNPGPFVCASVLLWALVAPACPDF